MATATLLPNAKQQFVDANGTPLAGGKVFFYIPNTSTLKNTWQDAGESILNTNPVILDGLGTAIIYGDGQYRQVLQDSAGNTLWDQLTNYTITTFTPTYNGALIVLGTDQSISDSSATNISFTSADYDTLSFWSAGSPTRITIPSGVSKVRLSAELQYAANATGARTFQINKNGSGVYNGRASVNGSAASTSTSGFGMNCSTAVINVSAGDYFEVNTSQNSGGSLAAQGGRTWLAIEVIL